MLLTAELALSLFAHGAGQMFTVELALNLFAHWFWPFFSSGWHVFDLGVVSSARHARAPARTIGEPDLHTAAHAHARGAAPQTLHPAQQRLPHTTS